MNGKPAAGPIIYFFPKIQKLSPHTGAVVATVTLQAAVAALTGHDTVGGMHPDEIASRLLAGHQLNTAIFGYRSTRWQDRPA